jgi:hypothetical protein
MQITEDAPIEVSVCRSKIDGALVAEIDTTDETGELRVYLNDGLIWDGDPESTTSARKLLMEINSARWATHKVSVAQTAAGRDAEFRLRVEKILQDAGVSQWEDQ